MSDFSSHQLISAYVDDRLSPEERADVEALLQSSTEARAEFESYRQLQKALQALPTESAPPDLVTRVMAQAEQESLHGKPLVTVAAAEEKGSFRKRWTIPAVSGVASLALGLLLVVMLQSKPREDASNQTAATGVVSNSTELASEELTATSTELERSRSADRVDSRSGELGVDEIRKMERNLGLDDRYKITQNGEKDGTINMLSAFDLRTAEVGDVVDAMQMKGDEVAVVKLTVLDRRRFLDSFHVLLSDLNVPQETRGANTYGERQNDYFAVYVEAGEGRFEALMENLRQNMEVEQMTVSTTIPSSDLNPYVAEQGYSDVWKMKKMKNQKATDRSSLPAAEALSESAPSQGAETGERSERPRPTLTQEKEAGFDDAKKPEQQTEAFNRSLAESEFPPPPPLPQSAEAERIELDLAETEPAAPEPAAPMKKSAEALELSYKARQVPLRLPESVGKKLIAPQSSTSQLSMSNGGAAGRPISKQKVDDLHKEFRKQQEPPPSARLAADATPADKPAAPKPEPAGPKAELAAPKPDAAAAIDEAQGNKSPARIRERAARPLQVLFVLTDEAAAATDSSSPAPAEAKPAPQKK